MSSPSQRRRPRVTWVLMALFIAASGVLTLAQQGACRPRGVVVLDAAPNVCRRVPSLAMVDPSARSHLARGRTVAHGAATVTDWRREVVSRR